MTTHAIPVPLPSALVDHQAIDLAHTSTPPAGVGVTVDDVARAMARQGALRSARRWRDIPCPATRGDLARLGRQDLPAVPGQGLSRNVEAGG